MVRPIEEPRAELDDTFGNKRTTYSHPAFGQIEVSRVQGGNGTLYGSDFRHHGYVVVRIAHSTMQRDLSRDWVSRRQADHRGRAEREPVGDHGFVAQHGRRRAVHDREPTRQAGAGDHAARGDRRVQE